MPFVFIVKCGCPRLPSSSSSTASSSKSGFLILSAITAVPATSTATENGLPNAAAAPTPSVLALAPDPAAKVTAAAEAAKEEVEGQLNLSLSEYSDDEVTALQGCTLEKMLKKLRSSEYTGVSLEKRTSRWLAQSLVSTAKRVYLGTFGSEVEAARTWDRMQLWLCKADGKKEEEVQLNFQPSDYVDEVTALQGSTQEEVIKKLRLTEERVANQKSKYTGVYL